MLRGKGKRSLDILRDTVLSFHKLVLLCLRLDLLYPVDIPGTGALFALLCGFIPGHPLSESFHGLLEIKHSITVIHVVIEYGLILIF